jgi:hypothetical protein
MRLSVLVELFIVVIIKSSSRRVRAWARGPGREGWLRAIGDESG